MTKTFTITMPQSEDALGRWLESNGAELALTCCFGTYSARLTWGKVHSYSDKGGTHKEVWDMTRHAKDATEAIRLVLEAAGVTT